MTNNMLKTAIASAAIAVMAGNIANAEEVRVFNWSEYVDPEVIEKFEAETGIDVIYDTFDSNEMLETRLLAGSSGFDVVVPSSLGVARLGEIGVLVPWDRAKLTNWGNLNSEVLAKMEPYDPGNALMAPYNFWTFGIVLNDEKVSAILGDDYPRGWELFFDPDYSSKLSACGIYIVDSATDVYPVALHYLGKDSTSKDKGDLDAVTEMLVAIQPNITKIGSDGLTAALANGDGCMGVTWSGDALFTQEQAIEAENGVELTYFLPSQGTSFDFDGFSILSDAPNSEAAHAFVNFMMRADVAAQNANYIRYGSANEAAKPEIDSILVDNEAVYPDSDALANLFTLTVNDLKTERVISRGWTRFQTGQ